MSSKEKDNRGAIDKLVLFNHIKEECIKDPFYMTKIIVGAVGKNALTIIVRIAIYVLVVFPILTVVLGVSQGVAALLTVAGIILYHSAGAIYHRISDEALKAKLATNEKGMLRPSVKDGPS